MRRWLFLVALALHSTAQTQNASSLQEFSGFWFASIPTINNAWTLRAYPTNRYSSAHPDSPPTLELAVDFGRADEGLKPAKKVALTTDVAGSPRLAFQADNGSNVSLIKTRRDQLDGDLLGANGTRHSLQLKRSTRAEVHRWLAENPGAKVRATRDSPVELVYVSAADCIYCRRWEGQYLENGAFKTSLGWAGVNFSTADIGSYKGAFQARHAPPHLQAAVERLLGRIERQSLRGTPSFLLFVNAEVRNYAFGTNDFETLIKPSIRAAVSEKALDAGFK